MIFQIHLQLIHSKVELLKLTIKFIPVYHISNVRRGGGSRLWKSLVYR